MNPFPNTPQYTFIKSILLTHLKKGQFSMPKGKGNDKPLARVLHVELTKDFTILTVDERKLEDQVYTDLTQDRDAYSFLNASTETLTPLGDSDESK